MKLYDNDAYRDEFMRAVYDLLSDDATNDRANQIIGLFDAASVIEAEPISSNDPLTLDQLREMNGEPVFLNFGDGGEWAIVRIRQGTPYLTHKDAICNHVSFALECGAKIYRRKPEV